MKEKNVFVLKLVPMLLVMGIIFFLSEQSGDTLSLHISLFYGADKIAHLLTYWVLAAAVIYAFSEGLKKRLPSVVVVLTLLFCLLYGISDEFHQSFTPDRSVSVFDVVADFTGALLCCIAWLWNRKRKKSGQGDALHLDRLILFIFICDCGVSSPYLWQSMSG